MNVLIVIIGIFIPNAIAQEVLLRVADTGVYKKLSVNYELRNNIGTLTVTESEAKKFFGFDEKTDYYVVLNYMKDVQKNMDVIMNTASGEEGHAAVLFIGLSVKASGKKVLISFVLNITFDKWTLYEIYADENRKLRAYVNSAQKLVRVPGDIATVQYVQDNLNKLTWIVLDTATQNKQMIFFPEKPIIEQSPTYALKFKYMLLAPSY